MVGCQLGHLGVVQVLVEHSEGQGLESTGHLGQTALHLAATWGHENVVKFLLSKGANANARDICGMTPLIRACLEGRLGAARVLAHHMGVQGLQDRDQDGGTALHSAAREQHEEVIRFLLLSGADPSIRDDQGRTPEADAMASYEDEGEDGVTDEERQDRAARCVAVFEVSRHTC
jgi:ankyrin repeat protein